ncbi:MAG: dihydrodipicolinate synthase family protein [Kordiimonadaceae bacterium]|nr:dihydrodipicolinate synthase family protein [Kordiimonadaceae bacterium]
MQGVIAAIPTPIDETRTPDKELFLAQCSYLLSNGCNGLNILGSTGEANSFDTQTRKTIMAWAAENLNRSQLMVGTGTPSLAETISLTCEADNLGYPVALVLPPYYYAPIADQGLIDWYSQLHKALTGRKIQIYFYNFPQMTGLTIPISVIAYLHEKWPERFSGIKDSSGKLEYCRELTSLMPDFSVFPSSEVSLGEANASGYAGCISATVNHTAPLCAQVWQAKEAPNRDTLREIEQIRTNITSVPLVPAIKYLVAAQTGQLAWERVLPPFCELDDNQKAALQLTREQVNGH